MCLTIDHWTSHRKGFVGFTAHWYNESLEMKHACVAIKRVLGRCTYDVLANLIHTVLEDYGIHNDEKASHCVTDSRSNFIKAFTDFSTHRDDATPNQAELGDSAMSPTSLDDILTFYICLLLTAYLDISVVRLIDCAWLPAKMQKMLLPIRLAKECLEN